MRKAKTTTQPIFSNGTEAMIWIGRNCDKCWKQSRYSKTKDKWINDRCSIDRDIQGQFAGLDEVYERSYNLVKNNAICPNMQLSKPLVHKKRIKKNQGNLFNTQKP